MNQPYRLDAEAIATATQPERTTLALWLVAAPRNLPRPQGPPTPGSPRQSRAGRLRRRLGQVLGRLRPRLDQESHRERHRMAHLGTADSRLPCPTTHRTGLPGYRPQT